MTELKKYELRRNGRILAAVDALIAALELKHQPEYIASCVSDRLDSKKNGRTKWLNEQLAEDCPFTKGLNRLIESEKQMQDSFMKRNAA